MRIISFTILVLLFAFSCEKDNESIFSGITERNEEGMIVGSKDNTDWRFDDVWDQREEKLFEPQNFKSTEYLELELDNYISDSFIGSSCLAYPNPAISLFDFEINTDADTARFVIVNCNYEIIFSKKISGGGGLWMFNASDRSMFRANSLYRIYYRFNYLNGTIERGHGDVKIK